MTFYCGSQTSIRIQPKVALVIGHPGIWNNTMIYMSEKQTIVSQCQKQPLLNQLYKVLMYRNNPYPEWRKILFH